MTKQMNLNVEEFYKWQINIFKILGVWPFSDCNVSSLLRKITQFVHFWTVFSIGVIIFGLSMFIHVALNISKLTEIIKVFYILATVIAVAIKLCSLKMNNKAYRLLFRHLNETEFLANDAEENVLYTKHLALSLQVRNYYAYLSLMALNSLLVLRYFSENTQLPISAYQPIDIEFTFNFWAMYIFQYIALSVSCVSNIAFDSMCTSLFLFIIGQLSILAKRLRELGINNKDSHSHIRAELKNCIRYYNRIEALVRSVEDVVTVPASMQIFCSVLVLIADFYALSLVSNDPFNFFGIFIYQICMLIQIYMPCHFSDEISILSEGLQLDLYKSNWVSWNTENRKLLLLMMLRFHTPMRIRTINKNYSFNMIAFTSIVNSSYSYFALLKRVNN